MCPKFLEFEERLFTKLNKSFQMLEIIQFYAWEPLYLHHHHYSVSPKISPIYAVREMLGFRSDKHRELMGESG